MSDEGARLGVEAARALARIGRCEFGPGLTDAEFARIEHEHGLEFADDHRAFLATGLPLNGPHLEEKGVFRTRDPWPAWRDGDPDALRSRLRRPVDGVLFDVQHDGTWHHSWGERPADPEMALETARVQLERVPQMVPVYAHRCLPAGRGTFGHPVLSIWQTDIIYYGMDLADYVHQEFGGPGMDRTDERWDPQGTVAFWLDF
ncbi:MAG: hypothetical protein L0I76_17990 [Pseudonocardia sp.]|nr:hypothetical protein [Pseudonocardia sp.]